MHKWSIWVLVLLALATAIAPTSAAGDKSIADVVVETASAKKDPQFTALLTLVRSAGLFELLDNPNHLTVFAPTDAAFAALGTDTIDALLADPIALRQLLLYHIVTEEVPAAAVVNLTSAPTLLGAPILISARDGAVYLNNAALVTPTDIVASNGIIHVIDAVISPPIAFPDDLHLVNGGALVVSTPGGAATGAVVTNCQTVFVNGWSQGFAHIEIMGGWVDARVLENVAENYGQPGGQPIVARCQ